MSEQSTSISAEEILAAVGLALVATDRSGSVVYWNQAAQDLYGWAAEEAVGSRVEDLTAPLVGQRTALEMAAALREGVSWSGGFPVSQKDGTRFPVLVTERGIYRNGDLVGSVGLAASLGSALRPLLERSPHAAVVLGPDGVVTYVSPSASGIFGWEASILGTSATLLLHPDDRAILARSLQEVAAKPRAVRAVVEVRVRSASGWVWAEASLTSMLDDAQVHGVVCSVRPSLRREAHDAATRQVEQLSTALQSRILIEQAKGFLIGRFGCTAAQGFERMRGYARSHHLEIHEVSRRVLDGSIDLSRG